MDPIFRLLSSDGEPYRLADDDFLKLAAWLAHPPRKRLSDYQTRRAEALQRDEQIRQLRRLLEYNQCLRQAPPTTGAEHPPLAAAAPSAAEPPPAETPATDEAAGTATEPAESTDEAEDPPELMFVDEGFLYGGKLVQLTGRSLEFFRAIAESRFRTLSRRTALDTIWHEANCEEHAVNQAVAALRSRLRKVYNGEPLETLGHGKTLAWRLKMPFRLVKDDPRSPQSESPRSP